MNDVPQHQGILKTSWEKTTELEGRIVKCTNITEGKDVLKVVEKVNKDELKTVRERGGELFKTKDLI